MGLVGVRGLGHARRLQVWRVQEDRRLGVREKVEGLEGTRR